MPSLSMNHALQASWMASDASLLSVLELTHVLNTAGLESMVSFAGMRAKQLQVVKQVHRTGQLPMQDSSLTGLCHALQSHSRTTQAQSRLERFMSRSCSPFSACLRRTSIVLAGSTRGFVWCDDRDEWHPLSFSQAQQSMTISSSSTGNDRMSGEKIARNMVEKCECSSSSSSRCCMSMLSTAAAFLI